MIWEAIRRLAFCFDAERVHRLTLHLLRLLSRRMGCVGRLILRSSSGYNRVWVESPKSIQQWNGLTFRNRLGLAAGFDKDAEILLALPDLGFGFVELGTVTPRPQEGNPRPRLQRDASEQAIFNRMGFNGDGMDAVSSRLRLLKASLPKDFRVGVNLGKNKATPDSEAAQDYAAVAASFIGLADYFVINVSSPNTPGLRALQNYESLKSIYEAVRSVVHSETKGPLSPPPILIKLAPEISGEDLQGLIQRLESSGVNGWVLTNTLGASRTLGGQSQSGGLSGKPLTALANQRVIEARAVTQLPIIGVGGILDAHDARERIVAGADLIQIYAGWIFKGPRLPKSLLQVDTRPVDFRLQ